jgi:hypothetical protein
MGCGPLTDTVGVNTKIKGDVAELAVATDLRRQGHKVAFPFGENWDADLLVEVADAVQRVQVKHTTSDGVTVEVRCYTQTIVAGRSRATRSYTGRTVDWLAVYDATTAPCLYLPAAEFAGKSRLHVRYLPCKRNRRKDVRMADDFMSLAGSPPLRSTGTGP